MLSAVIRRPNKAQRANQIQQLNQSERECHTIGKNVVFVFLFAVLIAAHRPSDNVQRPTIVCRCRARRYLLAIILASLYNFLL